MAKNTQPFIFDYHSPDWKNYVADIAAIKPINTAEKAAQYRTIWSRYHKQNIEYPVMGH